MKLKTFDVNNCRGRAPISPNPMISFVKSGVIVINPSAAKKLGLKLGDQIIFHQDENKKKNWYLEKRMANGFLLRKNKTSKSGSLIVNAAMVVREFLRSLGITGSLQVPISTDLIDGKYYAILTTELESIKIENTEKRKIQDNQNPYDIINKINNYESR